MINFKQVILAFCIFTFAGFANAIPVSGAVGFTGSYHTDTGSLADATKIFIDSVTVGGDISGSFAAEGIASGDSASYSDFTFNPSDPVAALWNVGSFTFDLDRMNVNYQSNFALVLSGKGITSSTDLNLDEALTHWVFTANSGGTFSASSTVPEPAVMLLLATGLIGFGFARKTRKAA